MQVVGQVNIGTNIENANTVNISNGNVQTSESVKPDMQVQPVETSVGQSQEQNDEEAEESVDSHIADNLEQICYPNEQYDPIDYIRVINAMFELGYFVDKTGGKLNKGEFFVKIGKVLGLDFSHYSTNLSKSITESNDYAEGVTDKLFKDLRDKAQAFNAAGKRRYMEKHR